MNSNDFSQASGGMDIARPDLGRRRRRLLVSWIVALVLLMGIVTVLLLRLEPAMPVVDRTTLWTNAVQRGEMIRQVRGHGTLVPERIQFVQAETGGTVEKIHVQPGTEVGAESVLLDLGSPELVQQAFDAEWAARGAEAQLTKLKVTLESDRLSQESVLVTLRSEMKQSMLEARANVALARDGLVSQIEMERAKAKAEDLEARVAIEEKRSRFAVDSAQAQLAVQQAEVEKLRAIRDLRQRQVQSLRVRAGIAGVLSQLGDREMLQLGQRVSPNATLAKVVVPSRLKAEIRITETLAKDVARGQSVEVDTRNGSVSGRVVRVDPAVQNGTVLVEVALEGTLPKGARPDLSVEGIIELERLPQVLHVGRPVQAQPDSTVGLFKLVDGGRFAIRVPVRLGRSSVSSIEVLDGLDLGDTVILNDMSPFDSHNKLRLR